MFSNIGNKIRVLAKVLCIIGIVIAIITGLVVMINGCMMLGNRRLVGPGIGMIFGGIIVAALGVLGAWISSFVLYGYGQLIHSVQNMEAKICGNETPGYDGGNSAFEYTAPITSNGGGKTCPNCGASNPEMSHYCEKCGQAL